MYLHGGDNSNDTSEVELRLFIQTSRTCYLYMSQVASYVSEGFLCHSTEYWALLCLLCTCLAPLDSCNYLIWSWVS